MVGEEYDITRQLCKQFYISRVLGKQQSFWLSSFLILLISDHLAIDRRDFGDQWMQGLLFLQSFTTLPGFLLVRHHSYLNEQSVRTIFGVSDPNTLVSVSDPLKTAIFQCFVTHWWMTIHCPLKSPLGDWSRSLSDLFFPEISYWPGLNWLWLIRASRVIYKTFIWKSL